MNDIYEKYFGKDLSNDFEQKREEIINFIRSCRDSFSLKFRSYEELKKKIEDRTYLSDQNFSFNENEITILFDREGLWDEIKDYIPKTVTKLGLPNDYIDVSFLSTFPNLTELTLNDYDSLSIEELSAIYDNTSIKRINGGPSFNLDSYVDSTKEDCLTISSPYNLVYYKDLLYGNIDEDKIKKYIEESKDESSFSFFGIKVKTNKNFNYDEIYNKLVFVDNRLKDNINITTPECKYEIRSTSSETSATIESDRIEDVVNFYNEFKNHNRDINSITWNLKSYNYYDYDLSQLEEISKNVDISIGYNNFSVAKYEEFKLLYENINGYRQSMNSENLSPVEKVLFAYDVMKSFKYNESDVNKDDSRVPHRIIGTGNIVCVGYSAMLAQILNYLDDGIKINEFGVSCYDKEGKYIAAHSRSIIKLDDDKYDLHGIYALDATWDSDRTFIKEAEGLNVIDALDLYNYFLVPAKDYEDIFSGDTLPDLFSCFLGKKYSGFQFRKMYKELYGKEYVGNYLDNSNNKDKSIINTNNLEKQIKQKVDTELFSYLNASRPSLDKFCEMLTTVRIAEGYSKEDVLGEVKRIVELNKNIMQDGDNNYFFKEEGGIHR